MSIYTLNFVSIEFLKSIKVIIIYILSNITYRNQLSIPLKTAKKKKK